MLMLIFVFVMFLISGSFFALPAFIPALRNRARQSSQYRAMLILIMSMITFLVFFIGATYLNAMSTKVVSFIASGSSYFWDDEERNAMLTQELWFRAMMPPLMLSDGDCLTGDSAVCEVATELRNLWSHNSNRNMKYIFMLASLLIPATVCGFTVRYITRDHRKEKVKETT